jgi:hypothetical protein
MSTFQLDRRWIEKDKGVHQGVEPTIFFFKISGRFLLENTF